MLVLKLNNQKIMIEEYLEGKIILLYVYLL
jgi:hypothetical protein